MSKVTEGPWIVQPGTTTGVEVVAPNAPKTRRVVARCGGKDREGNARFIAAAHDLAEAVKRLRRWMPPCGRDQTIDDDLAFADATLLSARQEKSS